MPCVYVKLGQCVYIMITMHKEEEEGKSVQESQNSCN